MKRVYYQDSGVTELEMVKWIHGVENSRLLNLLWVPHYHRTTINTTCVQKLLTLLHDGYLWLEEPIPITTEIIHRISRLPCAGRDPVEIVGTSGDLTIAEAMKKKYKLEKK